MTMVIRISFPTPLDKELQTRSMLAAGSLAKCQRVYFIDDYAAMQLSGEALSEEGVREAFSEQKIEITGIFSSLNAEENDAADDILSDGVKKERLRPIGR
ncbi:MAG: hypothetical protein HRU15_07750 [Planctomycetes bacterium]|nr:hypothetical protein [Planctomycetota bacterium]